MALTSSYPVFSFKLTIFFDSVLHSSSNLQYYMGSIIIFVIYLTQVNALIWFQSSFENNRHWLVKLPFVKSNMQIYSTSAISEGVKFL